LAATVQWCVLAYACTLLVACVPSACLGFSAQLPERSVGGCKLKCCFLCVLRPATPGMHLH